mmetsp:Transcript_66083/g.123261  ORF Transcript_66083/g.123261 Transcript_66083/m.123261 type:complete len:545 (-) Transcript_66083:57-1691(-)
MAAWVGDWATAAGYASLLAAADESGSVDVPWPRLAIAFGVICAEAAAAARLELGIADQLIVAGVRTLIQLSILGSILYPIFTVEHPTIVLGYIFFFMVPISASDCAARPKVSYDKLFRNAVVALAGAVLINGAVLLSVVRPVPWYDAQYVIPMGGMLVGNALTSAAVAVNTIMEHLSSKKEHVELLLAFGATPFEAAWPGITQTFHQAMTPMINQMNIMGIVSIPGMMTGQVLGGASPMKAAKYQVAITFMISGATTSACAILLYLTVKSLFDKRGRLTPGAVVKNTRWGIVQVLNPASWRKRFAENAAKKAALAEPLIDQGPASLEVVNSRPTPTAGEVVLDVVFEDVRIGTGAPLTGRIEVREGEVACLMGPSGVGKSTLLKMLSDLLKCGKSIVRLKGDRANSIKAQVWRREVLYLPQLSGSLPGTPQDFINTLATLKSRKGQPPIQPGPVLDAIGLSESFLQRPWGELSGGERQRTLVAIAATAGPSVLLLDEPTSALDADSKLLVDEQIRKLPCSVLMVTHDGVQAERHHGSIWKLSPK